LQYKNSLTTESVLRMRRLTYGRWCFKAVASHSSTNKTIHYCTVCQGNVFS